jgi:transcriptional regulator with XRE-family HTH domain
MATSAGIGGAIKRLRRAAGLTQRELARRLEVDATYLSHLEADRREPSLQLLRKLASQLNVPPGLLIAILMAAELPEEHRATYSSVINNLLSLAIVTQEQLAFGDSS